MIVIGLFLTTNYFTTLHKIKLADESAAVINRAGRQRMLSQRIYQYVLSLQINDFQDKELFNLKVDSLKIITQTWTRSDSSLRAFNSQVLHNSRIESLFNQLETSRMRWAVDKIIRSPDPKTVEYSANVIGRTEDDYLKIMDAIVLEFQDSFSLKLKGSQELELMISLSLVALFTVGFFYSIAPYKKELKKKSSEILELNGRLIESDQRVKNNDNEILLLKENLLEASLRNKLFIEQAPGAMAMFDCRMRYIAASHQWIKDYQLNGKEIIGKSHFELFPNVDKWVRDIVSDCLRGESSHCDQYRRIRLDGTVQWLTWDIRPWFKSGGIIGGLVAYTSDITKAKAKDEERLHIEKILDKSNEVARIGTWEIDLLRQELLWSRVTKEIHEVPLNFKPLLSTAIEFFKEGESRSRIEIAVSDAMLRGTSYDLELELVTAKGNAIWARAIGHPEFENGRCVRLYGVFQDITQKKKSETEMKDATKSMELLTTKLTSQNTQLANFAHITSHNLRSPVSNLNALLHFYKTADSEPDRLVIFEKFETVIQHLSSTLNTLVDALKIKEEVQTELELLSFEEVFNKTKEIVSAQVMDTQAIVRHDFTNAPRLKYNRNYLESIFLNLLTNSLKYRSPAQTPEIYVYTESFDDRVIMRVKDNGLGIDMNRHGHKLFGLNKTFHRHAEAKGIGLYITKTQVEAMGGKIFAESEVGKGSIFIVQF